MAHLERSIDVGRLRGEQLRDLLRHEWLVTNGLGGYASGTISGNVTRRYHGVLIAALPIPLGRVVMLNHLSEYLLMPNGKWVQIAGEETETPENSFEALHALKEFRVENGLPVWRFEWDGVGLEKRLHMVHGQNTTLVSYQITSSHRNIRLRLRPALHFRKHDHSVSEQLEGHFRLSLVDQCYEISYEHWASKLRLGFVGGTCTYCQESKSYRECFYLHESERGYESHGQLWIPGSFEIALPSGRTAALIASAEEWEKMMVLDAGEAEECEHRRRERLISMAMPQLRNGVAAELVLAADQFIINPVGRTREEIWTQASGDEIRTAIAGYHWFTDWGRDTMISLEGLTLVTGRYVEAGWILRTFANYIEDGLIPNLIPEGSGKGIYNTADASLWFFHALNRYLETTGDRHTLCRKLPQMLEIIDRHRHGTCFGIHVDAEDGLLCQGEEGYQLTWMDAKVGDWVVTPRRGKAVEINALWYNALKITEKWVSQEYGADRAKEFGDLANQVHESFNRRFWYAEGGYLMDVVDGEGGNDCAFRPNQLLAISLEYPVLDPQFWPMVLEKVSNRLLTPAGLRTLSPDDPDYKSRYFGDLRSRDAAYHQGTVWAWLIGPYIDALLRTHPERKEEAIRWLERESEHLNLACIGSISEVFDAEVPFTPRGCIAQAWSVAEVLRCWAKVLS